MAWQEPGNIRAVGVDQRTASRRATEGFTLIELMIVVAIIGILAAVALPSYKSFSTRAKVSECVNLLNPYKTAFTEYVAVKGGLPPQGESCVPFECNDADAMTKYCRGLTTVNDVIEIDIRPQAGVKDSCYIRLQAFLSGGGVSRWEGQTTCQFDEVPPEFRNRPRW